MKKNISKVMNILLKKYKKHRQPTVRRISKSREPFKVLISCLLSLRTQDKNTKKASENLFRFVKKPEDLIKIPIKKLEKLIYSSGHYRKKARVLKSVSKELIKRFKGRVPNNKEELLSMKGIGPKTANIVLAFAYNKNVIPVDVHVHVIANRLGWVKTKNPEKTEKELEKILPEKYWKEINTMLILFGQNTCITISPLCSLCIVRKYCPRIGVNRSR